MPKNSRKNRREINARREIGGTTASAVTQPADQAAVSAVKPAANYNASYKASLSAATAETNFLSELKWIAITTVVIVILLIVSYFMFH